MFAETRHSLKKVFGGIPTEIENNIIHLKVNGREFVCEPCNETIPVVVREQPEADASAGGSAQYDLAATTTNFNEHLSRKDHIDKTRSDENDIKAALAEVFRRKRPWKGIPQIVLVNIPFLKKEATNTGSILRTYRCKLCASNWSVTIDSVDFPKEENLLCSHLLSKSHLERYVSFSNKCREVTTKLEMLYGSVPLLVLANKQFLTKTSVHTYTCNLCDKPFAVHQSGVDLVETDFMVHLKSMDHKQKLEQSDARRKLPDLKHWYPENEKLPYYIIKNIYYIEFYNIYLICTLCQDIICERHDLKFTMKLKYHFTSSTHEDNLFRRRNPQNRVFRRLHELFDTFPNSVVKNLKAIGLRRKHFYCNLCNCNVTDYKYYEDAEYTRESLLAHFLQTPTSITGHEENLLVEDKKCLTIKNDLEKKKKFGKFPSVIQENMKLLCLDGCFVKCTICNANLQCFDNDPSKTEDVFNKHLYGSRHKDAMRDVKRVEMVVGQYFDALPELIAKNLKYICHIDTTGDKEYSYSLPSFLIDSDSDSDDGSWQREIEEMEKRRLAGMNFRCRLCGEIILIGKPDRLYFKDDETETIDLVCSMTQHNLRTHFLSSTHKQKMTEHSVKTSKTKHKLTLMFGGIPDFIDSNMCFIKLKPFLYETLNLINASMFFIKTADFTYACSLCNDYYLMDSKDGFERHFFDHQKSLCKTHQSEVDSFWHNHDKAMQLLDMSFWHIPEIILTNIDFLSTMGSNMICVLCQEVLYINEYDLEETELEFRHHLLSEKHQGYANGQWDRVYNISMY